MKKILTFVILAAAGIATASAALVSIPCPDGSRFSVYYPKEVPEEEEDMDECKAEALAEFWKFIEQQQAKHCK